jgi:hypothetical protein
MDKRFGKRGTLKGWKNVCIVQDDEYAKDETYGDLDGEGEGDDSESAYSVEVVSSK